MLHLQKLISPAFPSRCNLFRFPPTKPLFICWCAQIQQPLLQSWYTRQDSSSCAGSSKLLAGITLTCFIFDPNLRRAEEQPLCCSTVKTISALTDFGSVCKNKLSREHNLATFHVRQSVLQLTSGIYSKLSFKVVFSLPRTRMIKDDNVSPEQ